MIFTVYTQFRNVAARGITQSGGQELETCGLRTT